MEPAASDSGLGVTQAVATVCLPLQLEVQVVTAHWDWCWPWPRRYYDSNLTVPSTTVDPSDGFGASLCSFGSIVAVGAPRTDLTFTDQGAVYVSGLNLSG
jgi:hypothetical protein